MKIQKAFAAAAAVSLLLTGCTEIQQNELELDFVPVATETVAETTESTGAEEQIPSVALEVPEITQQEVSLLLEAEESAIPSGCSVSVMPRLGYSGTGYLSGLSPQQEDNQLSLTAEIPATQHYDITVVLGADEAATCQIRANGESVYTFTTEPAENFVRVTVQGIFLSEGSCRLSIVPVEGTVDIDCVEIVNNTSLYDDASAIAEIPVNENISPNAKALYTYLVENYGEKIITGQYASDSSNKELEEIYTATGAYPLIRFADVGDYTSGGDTEKATAVADSLAWAKEGGIVGLSWMWNAPTSGTSVYADKTEFSLSAAVTSADIATASSQELTKMHADGTISDSCYALLQDIDTMAEVLKPLADADVPVLWRPLMEAGGGWYWWGADGADAYCWLWNLLYTRMTTYYQLNNLLWIWNGQSSSYLVDESEYDIASLDLYVEQGTDFGSRYEQYVALRNMTADKLLAISECSNLPDMNDMFRDNAVWSFFGLWYAPYLGEYTSDSDLVSIYHSEGALTRGDYTAPVLQTASDTENVIGTVEP